MARRPSSSTAPGTMEGTTSRPSWKRWSMPPRNVSRGGRVHRIERVVLRPVLRLERAGGDAIALLESPAQMRLVCKAALVRHPGGRLSLGQQAPRAGKTHLRVIALRGKSHRLGE